MGPLNEVVEVFTLEVKGRKHNNRTELRTRENGWRGAKGRK